METEELWLEEVKKHMSDLYFKKDGEDYFIKDIYVDYREKYLSESTIKEIFEEGNPRDNFYGKLAEWEDNQWSYEMEYLEDELKNRLSEEAEECWEDIKEWIIEHVAFYYDPKDFDADIHFNIILDTGDADSLFSDNAIYPCYTSEESELIPNEASLLFLAASQGYSKRQVYNAMREEEPKSVFMKSLQHELYNATSSINALVLLIETDLHTAFDLMDAYHKEEKLNQQAKVKDRKGTGFIKVSKKATCGLYDPYNGGGSTLEIELEKDVEIPFRMIDSIKPDECGGSCSLDSIYGMCASEWRKGKMLNFHSMQEEVNAAS